MAPSEFVYVTYIKTTPEKLWNALTDPEIMKRWRFGSHAESGWSAGSPWKIVTEAGETIDSGEIAESRPPSRLIIKWRNEWDPEMKAEGYSRCTFDLEPASSTATQLTVTHGIDHHPSPFIEAVSIGWPKILSNLKTFLETGETVLDETR